MISKIEKLILYNQYEILKNLCPDEKTYYEDEQETIMHGSDSDIEETASNFTGASEEVKEEVYSILHMFRDISCSYSQYNPNQELPYSIRFLGFDGNEESEHYWYCYYLVNHAHKYEEYQHTELNSHSNQLDRYRRMLEYYNSITNAQKLFLCPNYLSREQIEAISNIK